MRLTARLAILPCALAATALMADGSAVGASAAAQSGGTGGIRGRLVLSRTPRSNERRPEVASPGAAGPRDRPDLRVGVVYLDQAPRAAFEEPRPARATMDQRNERFVPHVLPVMVGTVVDFPNSDATYHNVFSLSRAKRFDLGRYASGNTKSVRMDRPGVIRVFCDIHSHMNAFVVVFNHPYHALTDDEGRYRLDNIPAGTYPVTAWHEGTARDTRSVTIPPGGGIVDLDLLVQ
jgi:plastocyanin